jgi:16S rRNA (cytidine1402-2'-O)-methyltransferase
MKDKDGVSGSGTLYVTATPIGNLKDITVRAVEVLGSVSLVAAEDTRRSKVMLNSLGIRTRCISCHEHNEQAASDTIIKHLSRGDDVAFVTDAGTPGISDPGGRLVSVVRQAGFRVLPVPGPSAAAAAMSVSGFQASSFHFAGFLPSKKAGRLERLHELEEIPCPLVFFESPHRIADTIRDMIDVLGERDVFMGREITKLHETHFTGTLTELAQHLSQQQVKGEITLVVQGKNRKERKANELQPAILEPVMLAMMKGGMSGRDISEKLADITGVRKKELYEILNRIKV